jgi:hypothetical protein
MNSNRLPLTSDPNKELKNFSVGIVKTIFLTDLRIAASFLRTGRSLVMGCGTNDKLISLNALDIFRFGILTRVF